MDIFRTTAELRKALLSRRKTGASIALVPTMGNLHPGHLALIATARAKADIVVASIFVNPLQFAPGEDLDGYPRTPDADCKLLTQHHCDLLFLPSVEDIYGANLDSQTVIHVPGLSEGYCGRSRPGHFDGVATVVCKLFNIVQPDFAFFGLKDYQQFLVINKMARDLALDVKIEGVEIVRDKHGLALSSRNNYLSEKEKSRALIIHQCLQDCANAIRSGERDYRTLEQQALARMSGAAVEPDYFAICHASTLEPADAGDTSLVILAAAYVGPSRLIDNMRLEV